MMFDEVRAEEHSLRLLDGMPAILDALFDDMARAVRRVYIATYIYRDDKLGRAFASRMIEAGRRGADVRLLYDPLGSERTPPSFFDELRTLGVDARPYRPVEVILRAGPWPRNHCRILVVDEAGYIGGAAFGDEWLPRSEGGQEFHEVCVRLAGPCIDDYERAFFLHWGEATSPDAEGTLYATGSTYGDVELVVDNPKRRQLVYERHRQRMRRARRRIWLESAYFFPPRAMLEDLFDAQARGVDVKVIVPGKTDLPSIQSAARAERNDWIARGIELYEYGANVLHAKYGVIDDDWATVGTFNANPTSIRWANEGNLFVFDPVFVGQAAQLFENDLRKCRRLTAESVAPPSAWQRLKDEAWRGLLRKLEAGW